MKKIKILYTINYITNGGPSRVLINTINNLDKDNYEVIVLTLIDQNDQDIINELKAKRIKVIEYKMTKSIKSLFKLYRIIRKKIIDINADIIHTHGIVTSLIVASNKIKSYKITTIHNNIFEDYFYTYGKFKGRLIAIIHLGRLKKFSQIICCSKTSYEIIKNKFKNITFIRNGIDSNYSKKKNEIRKKIRKELNIPNDNIVYIYVGVLTNRKKILELVKMFNDKLDYNESLIIVGDGPLINDIKKIADDKIKIVGFKSNALDYFVSADVYTSNSSSEGFSISLIEALEAGLLLFVSDIPSHRECFEIDSNYYIGEYFNANNFKEKKLLLKDNYSKISKARICEFQNRYLSAKAMTKEYEKYYEKGELLNGKKS